MDNERPLPDEALKPTPETYRAFIENEWRDVHHSRIQEWSALGVVVGAQFAIFQAVKILREVVPELSVQTSIVAGGILAGLFACFGGLITLRHRRLMRVKLNWIFQAEEKLGLIKDDNNVLGIIPRQHAPTRPLPWKGLSWPRPLSTSGLILAFYLLLFTIDALAIYFALT